MEAKGPTEFETTFYGIPITEKQVKQFRLDSKVKLTIVGTIESLHSGEGKDSKDTMGVSADSIEITLDAGNEFETLSDSEEK